MSYFEALKNGNIPEKKQKKQATPYDEYMAQKRLKTSGGEKAVVVIKPLTVADTEKLIDVLKGGKGLVADLSLAPALDAQRMLDFLSGAVYALDGKIERVDNKTFLITPKGVEILNQI